ncbi:MAG TPA: hypothetical protein VKU90_04020 [Caulobacteraceae bacterium]|jgi:hypothetical protein|nr:hypothetical protein [Caulobacteraceae bacterium]
MRSFVLSALTLIGAAALGGCQPQVDAPTDKGICWQAVQARDGKVTFNKVSAGERSIETCAAALEGMREHFLTLGGSAEDITGAYQGNFLFLQKEGVFTAETLNGPRYFLLGRTADGRLATAAALSTGQ